MAKGLRSVFSVWLIVLYLGMLGLHECSQPIVPGVYIFGDSTVDVGTNHYLPKSECRSRADFLYNGIDFPHSIPTGRFSNGFNIADHIGIYNFHFMPCLFNFVFVSFQLGFLSC